MELNFKTERKTMRKGFTLIELLVVVLIMGILASVAMPQYFKSVEKSRTSEAIDAISAIASAQERNYMQKGSYASNLSELDVGISNLNYFTVVYIQSGNADSSNIRLVRNTAAGAGLGSYAIALKMPKTPGTGERSWSCSPISAGCSSFMPIIR